MREGFSPFKLGQVIDNLADGQMFTTLDLQPLGTRGTIDQALVRFCRIKKITRVARGIYVKGTDLENVTVKAVAQLKARTYGKTIWEIDGHRNEKNEVTFATDGSSSSFWANGVRVRLIHMSPRKRVKQVVRHSPQCNDCSFLATPVSNFVYNLVHNG